MENTKYSLYKQAKMRFIKIMTKQLIHLLMEITSQHLVEPSFGQDLVLTIQELSAL